MSRNNPPAGRMPAEGVSPLAPALLVALLVAISRASASPRPPAMEEAPEPCGVTPPLRGESRPLDLEAVRRGYLEMRRTLETSLDRFRGDAEKALGRPYDAGLPSCRGTLVREYAPPAPLPRELRGRKLAFLEIRDPSRLRLPRSIEEDPTAEILIVYAARLRDLGELSRTWGRRTSLAGSELARGLGVRCANTWIEIGERGDAITLHEDD